MNDLSEWALVGNIDAPMIQRREEGARGIPGEASPKGSITVVDATAYLTLPEFGLSTTTAKKSACVTKKSVNVVENSVTIVLLINYQQLTTITNVYQQLTTITNVYQQLPTITNNWRHLTTITDSY